MDHKDEFSKILVVDFQEKRLNLSYEYQAKYEKLEKLKSNFRENLKLVEDISSDKTYVNHILFQFLDITKFKIWRKDKRFLLSKVSLQAKLALIISIILILAGAVILAGFEWGRHFAAMTVKEKLLAGYFQSVTSRTAGFNTIDISRLAPYSLFFLIFMMFIGASPGSTGGGIKTVTFGIILFSLWSMLKNRSNITVFKLDIRSM